MSTYFEMNPDLHQTVFTQRLVAQKALPSCFAKFQELAASASNSLGLLTRNPSQLFFQKALKPLKNDFLQGCFF